MSETNFKRACRLVDAQIQKDGVEVSPVERNKRVLAAEHNLRQGVPEDQIDTRSQISTISVASLLDNSTAPVRDADEGE